MAEGWRAARKLTVVVSGKVPNFGIANKITTPIHEEIAEPGCKKKSYLRYLFTSCIKPAQTETKKGGWPEQPFPRAGRVLWLLVSRQPPLDELPSAAQGPTKTTHFHTCFPGGASL